MVVEAEKDVKHDKLLTGEKETSATSYTTDVGGEWWERAGEEITA